MCRFQFQTRVLGQDVGQANNSTRGYVVKGYHECPFIVSVGETYTARKKRGDRGPALKVIDENGSLVCCAVDVS